MEEDVRQLQETVKSILARVKSQGDSAVRYCEKEFDPYDPPSFRVSEEQAVQAAAHLPAEVIEELAQIRKINFFVQSVNAKRYLPHGAKR